MIVAYVEANSHLQRRVSINQEPLQRLVSDADTHSTNLLAADLKFHFAGVIDKDTVTPVRHVKWDTFVRLLTRRPAILVPYTDALTVLHKCTELLSKAVEKLPGRYRQL